MTEKRRRAAALQSKPSSAQQPMSAKQKILDSIASIAKRLGRAPTHSEFMARSGVSRYFISKSFSKWNDAVRAAGLDPYTLNVRLQDSALLEDWGETVRRNRKIPAARAYQREGKYDRRTIENRFGSWSALPQAFRNFAKGRREWADVVALLPVPKAKEKPAANENSPSSIARNKVRHVQFQHRPIYGNPIDFRGLRHEPVNEQGVVLMFGMVAKELGYMVEAVQTGFPDCEAKRQIGPGRWQCVRIEFEFESRKFRDHGHPTGGCDVIVCWRHNWHACPEHIEVVELSSVIKSLPNSKD